MSGLGKVLLVEWFPRAGFRWRRNQGSPRILRSNARDAIVQRAIIDLRGGEGKGGKVRKRDAQALVVEAIKTTTAAMTDANVGIQPQEGIIDFLARAAKFSELSAALPEDVLVELVYQIADARSEYERRTPAAQKHGNRDQLTALALAAAAATAHGDKWDWMALRFYVYPHLIGGEAVDYVVEEEEEEEGDEDEDSEGGGGEEMGEMEGMEDGNGEEERKKMEKEAATRAALMRLLVAAQAERLPGQMEGLGLRDAEGDVRMGE